MKQPTSQWINREKSFSAFATGPLLHFWRQRRERQFIGKDQVVIRYVCFTSPSHHKAVLIAPGRTESYIKYQEVAWDLFSCGYDVFIIDHRGQGLSGRMLADSHLGHVEKFSDYVDDLQRLYQLELTNKRYQLRFALAHSMGAAIVTLLLQRQANLFDASALVAPMFGLILPMPDWMAERVLSWTEARPNFRENFAFGTHRWHAAPFAINILTHSRVRYQRALRCYADRPELQVGGPTAHWVREAINVGRDIEALAPQMSQPMLIIQASDDQVVNNQAQNRYCLARSVAGYPCYMTHPQIIPGARHEILFEIDDMRAQALTLITDYFASVAG